jgi:hypothetical protein
LVTDDFQLIGPFGFVLEKTQWLDRYRSGDLVTTELSWHHLETRTYGEKAVAIGPHWGTRDVPSTRTVRVRRTRRVARLCLGIQLRRFGRGRSGTDRGRWAFPQLDAPGRPPKRS